MDAPATLLLPQPLNDIVIFCIAVVLIFGAGNWAWKALRRVR